MMEGQNNIKQFGEVFTPPTLVTEMLDTLPKEVWSDPNKTWLDPAAGHGQFFEEVLRRLMLGLSTSIPDEESRKKHILECMLYQIEIQPESCKIIEKKFNPEGKYKLNLYCGDALKDNPWDDNLYHEWFE